MAGEEVIAGQSAAERAWARERDGIANQALDEAVQPGWKPNMLHRGYLAGYAAGAREQAGRLREALTDKRPPEERDTEEDIAEWARGGVATCFLCGGTWSATNMVGAFVLCPRCYAPVRAALAAKEPTS